MALETGSLRACRSKPTPRRSIVRDNRLMWVSSGSQDFAHKQEWKQVGKSSLYRKLNLQGQVPGCVYRQLSQQDFSHSFTKLSVISCKHKVFLVTAAHEVGDDRYTRARRRRIETLTWEIALIVCKMLCSQPPLAGYRTFTSNHLTDQKSEVQKF